MPGGERRRQEGHADDLALAGALHPHRRVGPARTVGYEVLRPRRAPHLALKVPCTSGNPAAGGESAVLAKPCRRQHLAAGLRDAAAAPDPAG